MVRDSGFSRYLLTELLRQRIAVPCTQNANSNAAQDVEAFDQAAVDYVMKPFSVARLTTATSSARGHFPHTA